MNLRERILSVYRGQTPDVVPFMLDLSHWFYEKHKMPWDLNKAYEQPETELIACHKRLGVGFCLPNLAMFYSSEHRPDVEAAVVESQRNGMREITWSYQTPLGRIARTRVWHPHTYSWHIKEWGIKTEQELRVLAYALSGMSYTAHWENYRAWTDEVGEIGVVYLPFGYSAMGQLLNYWMGIEQTMLATCYWPGTVRVVVDQINDSLLKLIDLLAASPAEIVIMGDNFSGDVQPPVFFAQWSRPFYVEAIRRLHEVGKFVAVHIDGRLRGALGMIREAGGDCGDAITPEPTGDLSMEQCRDEAGADFILSGGISPALWLPNVSTEVFTAAVRRWLELRRRSPRLIANAGDQVPPGAVEGRIELMRDLVEQYGRF